jgi:hypothetical protein
MWEKVIPGRSDPLPMCIHRQTGGLKRRYQAVETISSSNVLLTAPNSSALGYLRDGMETSELREVQKWAKISSEDDDQNEE